MFDRLRALLRHLHQVQDVNALTDRDLADLGMTRDQLLDFLAMPTDIAQRVTAMGAIFGVPEAALRRDHGQWVDLLSSCGHCADRGTCARVLELGDLAHPDQAHFCGNRPVFQALAASTV